MSAPYSTFVGIDISKQTLDFSVYDGLAYTHIKIENSIVALTDAFKTNLLFSSLKKKKTLICFESMGVYQNHLVTFLLKKKMCFSIQSPLHIKLSMGLVRGKSDKIDAERIALFASKNSTILKLWEPPRPVIGEIKQLLAVRKRLLLAKTMLKTPLKEALGFNSKGANALISTACKAAVEVLTYSVADIEKEILSRIQEDERLARLYEIITSVHCIGFVIASTMIAMTNEFKNFDTASQFASYIGIAPFPRTSGTSLNVKPHISHYGNKEMKTLLHLPAISCQQWEGTFKRYFERKKAEGKPGLVVLNAIKNKFLRQIFTCVREDRLAVRL